VLVAASTPNLIFIHDPLIDHVARKVGHFILYLAIAFGAGTAAGMSPRWSRTAWLVLFGAAALAVVDEAIQSHVRGRLSSPLDVAIDILGVVFGIFACIRFENWRTARS
jgi:VanZ family protein